MKSNGGQEMRECDLIMKGGITSGVVYPVAIEVLATKYRLRSIGGSSAGAIAATIAAAAEYRRQSDQAGDPDAGFQRVGALANELGDVTGKVFQPYPALADLYAILIAAVSDGGGLGSILKTILKVYKTITIATLLAVVVSILLGAAAGSFWLGVLGVVLSLLGGAVAIAAVLAKRVFRDLPQHDFGLCPGLTVPGNEGDGLTNWIMDRIDEVAGRPLDGNPLLISDLEDCGIELAAMTTDLSSQRPYQLPLRSSHHFFSRAEFEKLFPKRMVDYLCGDRTPGSSGLPDGPNDLYPLPESGEFPVALCARMSLSFPGLISAVPLWRRDFNLKNADGGAGVWRRCLFSDGGISSNFPVLFFDQLLPSRPTFGISLGSWEEERHGEERVFLSKKHIQSTNLPARPVKGVLGFVFSILNTSKDWQDTLQSMLPGYAERIVEIRLDDANEGGMNLAMSPQTIQKLTEFGREAGQKLIDEFDFDENRWRRGLSALSEVEGALQSFHNAYVQTPPGMGDDGRTYGQILTEHDPSLMKDNSQTWRQDVLDGLAGRLAKIGEDANEAAEEEGVRTVREGNVPKQDASLKILANADRRVSE